MGDNTGFPRPSHILSMYLQLVRTRTDCGQVNPVLPILFVASYSYNKSRANTHATVIKLSFGHFFL